MGTEGSTVVTPWGEEPVGSPDLNARLFAHNHFIAGHHYDVGGELGKRSVRCNCGASYSPVVTSWTSRPISFTFSHVDPDLMRILWGEDFRMAVWVEAHRSAIAEARWRGSL
jgi:hypothetical protein